MKDMNWIEWLVVAVIVLIVAVSIIGFVRNRDTFDRVCVDAGGTTVWDGRQYQCVKK